MKVDYKGIVVLLLVIAALVGGAYVLGLSSGNHGKSGVGGASSDMLPSNDSGLDTGSDTEHQFSHFRVGNRNVKGMAAAGDYLWVGTSGGVLRYNLLKDNYELFDVSTGSLLSNGVFHVSVLDDLIMVGTYGGGLSVFNTRTEQWKNYNIPDGLADQFVYDVQKVSSGDVWIATWSGVNRVKGGKFDDPANWTTFNPQNTQGGLPNDWVYGLEEGKDGAMWFATEKGVARYHQGKWQNWQHEEGLGAAYDLVKDDIAFQTDPGQASRHHARQKEEDGLSGIKAAYNPNYVVSLEIGPDGTVWAGTWGGGLSRFDNGKWTNFTVKEGLPSNHIFMLHQDPDGQIWAGTSAGLARVVDKGQGFRVLTRKQGLYADNVFSMARTEDGSTWVGSFGGVARLLGEL